MENIIVYSVVVFVIAPVILGVFIGRAIYSDKRRNPKTGAIIGGIASLLTSYLGPVIVYLLTRRIPSYKNYPLKRGEPPRLGVSWSYGFRKVTVELDGNVVSSIQFNSVKDVKEGKLLTLPDGSEIHVKIGAHPGTGNPVPDITLNGKAIPGSRNDAEFELNIASNNFYASAFINALAGVVYSYVNPLWYTILLFAMGIASLFVGLFVRRRSGVALQFGVVIAIVASLTYVLALFFSEGFDLFDNILGLVGAVIGIVGVFKGFKAINQLENESKGTP